jgi:sterol desaturase/sphingolipid hydroxylase (fatty acid hydroxylase superfamily)
MTAAQALSTMAGAQRLPFKIYKRQQAALARSLLLPVTFFYTANSIIMFIVSSRSAHPYVALGVYLFGAPLWSMFEYLSHRYVLHGRFKPGKSLHRRLMVKYLNPLHWEHHERPFDGEHISGELQDLLPVFAVLGPLSFIFPIYTAPMLLASLVQSFVIGEWVHHSIHFYNFRNPYFRYIRKHHIYHHTSNGMNFGYGFTSAFWDTVFKTRFPLAARRRLYGNSLRANLRWRPKRSDALQSVQQTFQS